MQKTPLTPQQREAILTRALTRRPAPLVRRLSTGVVAIGRQLGLNLFLPKAQQVSLTPAEARHQQLAVAWLLDKRNSIDDLAAWGEQGWPAWRAAHVEVDEEHRYEFNLPVGLEACAQRELEMSLEEMQAADFQVEPKPETLTAGPTPPGNS